DSLPPQGYQSQKSQSQIAGFARQTFDNDCPRKNTPLRCSNYEYRMFFYSSMSPLIASCLPSNTPAWHTLGRFFPAQFGSHCIRRNRSIPVVLANLTQRSSHL